MNLENQVARDIVVRVCIIAVSVMKCSTRMVMNGLEDWCEQMLECCKAKSIHELEPIMASIANDEDCGDFIDDKSFKGAWCKYELTDSNLVGDVINRQ